MHILYLYGFASGPQSDKAQFFRDKFSTLNVSIEIYDYIPDRDSFMNLKTSSVLTRLHSHIEQNYPEEELILIGSSYGGLISAWYTGLHPQMISKMILMAPAFRFSASSISKSLQIEPSLWKEQGFVLVFHYRYNQEIPLDYSFYEDILTKNPPNFEHIALSIPILIFHGQFDEVVPFSYSKKIADLKQNYILHALNGDHQLLDQKETMWKYIKDFLRI